MPPIKPQADRQRKGWSLDHLAAMLQDENMESEVLSLKSGRIEVQRVLFEGHPCVEKRYLGNLSGRFQYENQQLQGIAGLGFAVRESVAELRTSATPPLHSNQPSRMLTPWYGHDTYSWHGLLDGNDSPFRRSVSFLLAWVRGVLKACDEFHSLGFVHCDLLPQNIVIRHRKESNGNYRLLLDRPYIIDLEFCLRPMYRGNWGNGWTRDGWYDDFGRPLLLNPAWHSEWICAGEIDKHVTNDDLWVLNRRYKRLGPGKDAPIALLKNPFENLSQVDWGVDLYSLGCALQAWIYGYSWEENGITCHDPGADFVGHFSGSDDAAYKYLLSLPKELRSYNQLTAKPGVPRKGQPHRRIVDEIDKLIGCHASSELVVELPMITNGRTIAATTMLLTLDESLEWQAELSSQPPTVPIMSELHKPGESLDFVVDGSNVLLSNTLGGIPSVRLFAALLFMLDRENKRYKVWFDKSIYPLLEQRGGDLPLFKRLVEAMRARGCIDMQSHADPHIQADCQANNAPVINGGDKMDSWRGYIPQVMRCRLSQIKGKNLHIYVNPAGHGKKLMSLDASAEFTYGSIHFGSLQHSEVDQQAGLNWVSLPKFRGGKRHGNLLVIVLDASISMNESDTYDGRTKHEHVNEILRLTVEQLSRCQIASSLYLSVLSFSDDVELISPNDSGAIFSTLSDWLSAPNIDYLSHVKRGNTNIRLALDRAADFIDGFRLSEQARQIAQNWSNATIVMLTDGGHYVVSSSGPETEVDIDDQVFATLNRAQSTSFGFIGLGKGAKHDALMRWASQATDIQIDMAKTREIPLERDLLYVKANEKNKNLGSVVRSFIDIASARA